MRRFGIIGDKTATRITFQNLDGCRVSDSNGSTDEGVFCERAVGKVKIEGLPENAEDLFAHQVLRRVAGQFVKR